MPGNYATHRVLKFHKREEAENHWCNILCWLLTLLDLNKIFTLPTNKYQVYQEPYSLRQTSIAISKNYNVILGVLCPSSSSGCKFMNVSHHCLLRNSCVLTTHDFFFLLFWLFRAGFLTFTLYSWGTNSISRFEKRLYAAETSVVFISFSRGL